MNNFKKRSLSIIKLVANELPEQQYRVWNKISIRDQKQIIEQDELLGIHVDYKKLYIDSLHKVNHYRRMKRAYIRGGYEAVNAYLVKLGASPIFSPQMTII